VRSVSPPRCRLTVFYPGRGGRTKCRCTRPRMGHARRSLARPMPAATVATIAAGMDARLSTRQDAGSRARMPAVTWPGGPARGHGCPRSLGLEGQPAGMDARGHLAWRARHRPDNRRYVARGQPLPTCARVPVQRNERSIGPTLTAISTAFSARKGQRRAPAAEAGTHMTGRATAWRGRRIEAAGSELLAKRSPPKRASCPRDDTAGRRCERAPSERAGAAGTTGGG